MILRQFRSAGIEAFKQFLVQGRERPKTKVPTQLLEANNLTEVVKGLNASVENRQFATRRDCAEYLKSILEPLPHQSVAENAGLWTWLSVFYFDLLCPADADGNQHVKNDYHYVFEPKNPRHFYRHL